MIDPQVRPATAADGEQLRWLESIARRALIDQRGGPRWLATHTERGELWESAIGVHEVYIAQIDDVVVGYLVARVDGSVLQVDEVFVHPEAREVGCGDGLLAAALNHGRTAGLRLLEGEALPGDREMKNLYERAGIKARLITVSTELGPEPYGSLT